MSSVAAPDSPQASDPRGSDPRTATPGPRVDAGGRLVVPPGLVTSQGRPLAEVLADGRVLMVLLRHSGCTFCREALADLRERRAAVEAAGATPVVVHQGDRDHGRRLLDRYDLGDLHAVADPRRELYRALELPRGSLRQLFGPRVWWRGLLATLRGHFVGPLVGDGFQMPGAFVLDHGRIVHAYRHASADDRPDYPALCRVAPPEAPAGEAR